MSGGVEKIVGLATYTLSIVELCAVPVGADF